MQARSFRAMGSDMEIVLAGEVGDVDALLDRAVALVEELEACWSRFRPASELRRLNRDGVIAGASATLYDVVAAALDAWRWTDGRFDPTVLDALVAAGYDRSFEEIAGAGGDIAVAPSAADGVAVDGDAAAAATGRPAPGPVGIDLDPATRTIRLPEGVRLDLGGIGKGRAADLVAASLRSGAPGGFVNLGGDVRTWGRPDDADRWLVGIDDPFAPPAAAIDLAVVALEDGAVATTSRTRRRWTVGGQPRHHVIDPATGQPASRGVAAVTVVSASAERAEITSKAAFVAGADLALELIADAGAEGLVVADDGTIHRTSGFASYEAAATNRRRVAESEQE